MDRVLQDLSLQTASVDKYNDDDDDDDDDGKLFYQSIELKISHSTKMNNHMHLLLQDNFGIPYENLFNLLKKHKGMIAGGAALKCFYEDNINEVLLYEGDLDIYIPLDDRDLKIDVDDMPECWKEIESKTSIKNIIDKKIEIFLKNLLFTKTTQEDIIDYDFLQTLDEDGGKIDKILSISTFTKVLPTNNQIKEVQIIYILINNKRLLKSFDLSFCAVGYDGVNTICLEPELTSKKVGYILNKPKRTKEELDRITKYTNRGFTIYENKKDIPDTTILPPIYFIPFKKFKKKNEFPRFPNDKNIAVDLDEIDASISFLVFISHCWIAGWCGSADWRGKPHPDNMRNDKYKLCIKAIELTWKTLAPDFEKCYVWLDFGCINQDGDPAGELKQLSKIVSSCDCILTPIVDYNYTDWEITDVHNGMLKAYKAESWSVGEHAYLNRAWCRMEMYYAANITFSSDKFEKTRIDKFRDGLKLAALQKRRPHILYGTKEFYDKKSVKILEPLQNLTLKQFHPDHGSITKQSDRFIITALMNELDAKIIPLKIGYEGDIINGMRHGIGTYIYEDNKIYKGNWSKNNYDGFGVLTFSNGGQYEGSWFNNKKHGHGKWTYADGKFYEGNWKLNLKHGKGLFYAEGKFTTGYWFNNKFKGNILEDEFLSLEMDECSIKTPCRFYFSFGNCMYGENCKNSHTDVLNQNSSFNTNQISYNKDNLSDFDFEVNDVDNIDIHNNVDQYKNISLSKAIVQTHSNSLNNVENVIAKKEISICHFFKSLKGCKYGDNCNFIHK